MRTATLSAVVLASTLAGCGVDETVNPIDTEPYETLTKYGFFQGALTDVTPAEDVHAYDVAATLWADHARKDRFLVVPKGKAIDISAGEDWAYPDGSTIIKTFSMPLDLRDPLGERRFIETRLLLYRRGEWTGHVYLWNDDQTEATRSPGGHRVRVSYIEEDGSQGEHEYVVPNTNQCDNCHVRNDVALPIGSATSQVNHMIAAGSGQEGQIPHLVKAGALTGAPPDTNALPSMVDPFGDAPLDERARSYLHANCAHCHRVGGAAAATGLILSFNERDPEKNGLCKRPAAAGQGTGGFAFDIVPGDPDKSILPFRMSSLEPDIKMPELANRLTDEAGLALIRAWIAAMPAQTCE